VTAVGPVVRHTALLCATGIVAPCTVETWQEQSSSGRSYTRCRIVNEPPDLPDGPYQLEFADHKVPTRRWSGLWELIFIVPAIGTGTGSGKAA